LLRGLAGSPEKAANDGLAITDEGQRRIEAEE
jgi:hypothetical protein